MGLDTHPDHVLAVGAAFIILCTVIVPLRFYTRHVQNVGYGADDWLTIPALIMVLGCGINLILGVKLHIYGYSTPPPVNMLDPDNSVSSNFTEIEQLEWAFFLMQILSMGFIKLSFLFFFRRLFVTGKAKSRFGIVSMITVVIVILWTVAFFLWFLLSCGSQFSARWTTLATLHSACPTDVISDLALAISDMVTDVMVLGLPIPMVLRLNMKIGRRIAVLAVFGLGFVALVASIIRLAEFVMITRIAAGIISSKGVDNNLLVTKGLYWSMLESGLALIACCLPTVSFLARRRAVVSMMQGLRNITIPRDHNSSSADQAMEKSGAPTLGFTDSMFKFSSIKMWKTSNGSNGSKDSHADTMASKHAALNFERDALAKDSRSSLDEMSNQTQRDVV